MKCCVDVVRSAMWSRRSTLWSVLLVAAVLWGGGCEGHSVRSELLRRAAAHRIHTRGAFARDARDGPDGTQAAGWEFSIRIRLPCISFPSRNQ